MKSGQLPKTSKNTLAYLISRIFGPVPLLFVLWILSATRSGIGFYKTLWVYPLILALSLAIPVAISTYLIKTKKIKNIEWSDIEDRKKYFFPLALIASVTSILLTYFLTNPTTFHLNVLLCLIIIILASSYKFLNFKISGHIAVATMTFSALILYFGFKFLWLFLLLLPVMWARRTLKVHTWPQLLAGFIVPGIIMLAALLIFGWPKVG